MKVIIFIVLIFIVLYLLYKSYYHNRRHIDVKKNIYVDLTYQVKNMNNECPNYLFETYHDKSVIPLRLSLASFRKQDIGRPLSVPPFDKTGVAGINHRLLI